MVRVISAEEELERIRFEASCNEASALNHARREATKKKAIAIAQKMKNSGADINYIIEMTDLTVDDILQL